MVVIASIYASTAFLKHSKKYEGPETTKFCSEIRKAIFEVVAQDVASLDSLSLSLNEDYVKYYKS